MSLNKQEKKKKNSHKKALIVIGCIAVLIVALIAAGAGAVNHYLNKINKVDDNVADVISPDMEDFETEAPGENAAEADTLDPDAVQWGNAENLSDDHLLNILLVGQDRRAGQPRQRSDTMILCSINTETKQISLISFMRDLYVQIPGGYSDNRLNAAYAFGGFPLLDDTLTVNFGVHVDANIEVDFERFISVIDTLGGVDIELTAAEAEIVKDGAVAGMNHLSGEQALRYARIRKIDSDFNRTERQRKILEEVFEKTKSLSLKEMLSLADVILPSLTTDLDNGEMISLLVKCFPIISSGQLNSYRVPADNAYYDARIRGMAVLVPDLALIREHLRQEYLPL